MIIHLLRYLYELIEHRLVVPFNFFVKRLSYHHIFKR
jgi:hypothetical protein